MGNNSINLKDLLPFTSDLDVLYVEDQLDVMEKVLLIFSKLFKSVKTANNGVDGLEKFLVKKPDLIITDINMPKMNGLEFIEEIRKRDAKQPVIITSAHNENDYLIKSIGLSVDGFILKPINSEQIYNALLKTCKAILVEKESEYYKKHLEEKVREETFKNYKKTQENLKNIHALIDAYPTPVLVEDREKVVEFMNAAFRELFAIEDDEKSKKIDIDHKLLPYDGSCSRLSELKEKNSSDNIVAVKTEKGKKIFRVFLSRVVLGEQKESLIYTFTDITIEEYRKQKIKNYSGRLEDYIIKSRKKSTQCQFIPKERDLLSKSGNESDSSRSLQSEEEEILRKSHKTKISAEIYTKDVDGYVLDELAELYEIEEELKELIFNFEESFSETILKSIGKKLFKYGSTVSLLFEFEDLAIAIKGVSEFLEKIEIDGSVEKNLNKLAVIMQSIIEDLISWRDNIFLSKATQDIHYLDSSLFSSCLQLEISVLEEEVEDSDNGELDLF